MGRIGSSFAPLRRSALLHRSAPLTSFADRHTRILLPFAVNPLLCGLNSGRTIQKKPVTRTGFSLMVVLSTHSEEKYKK